MFSGFLFLIAQSVPFERDDLARILVRQGKREEAIEEYVILTVIGPNHRNRNLVHPIYHYRLAKLYEDSGRAAEARSEYGRFLKVLEIADAETSEMADAKKRLVALSGARP
jgi:tetratricopeptide (TPR) repeat protein